ncbi:MAG: hypothetical protein G8345_13575 [Magnetococcales bacterium]|nr:hypothetical protein [Magnetococcales bacterium]NGZ27904.1 hypothetical protein [Magnetococcales bacterium]
MFSRSDDTNLSDLFQADTDPSPPFSRVPPWKILMVDDDADIHAMTLVLLKKAVFQGRPIEFISAYSSQQAKELLQQHSDVAVILLDVVMESDNSGLALVSHIRQEMGNTLSRIILRTGHPGGSGEKQLILDYEVSDYREKADLTSNRLFTSVVAALRTYSELASLEEKRFAMKRLVENTAHLYRLSSPSELCQLALSFWINRHALIGLKESGGYRMIAGIGRWRDKVGSLLHEEELDTLLDPQLGNHLGYRWSLTSNRAFIFIIDLKREGGLDEEFFQAFCISLRSALEHCCEHQLNPLR